MYMKKSLIALAVASAFVAPAAMAEATVYGTVHVSIDRADDGVDGGAAKTNELNSRKSRLGFKGEEKLDGGMSAIWQIESQIDVDDGKADTDGDGIDDEVNGFATRNTFVGLKSDSMGTVLVGNYDTPYKLATRRLDVFASTAADNRSGLRNGTGEQGMGFGHDMRAKNSLNYTSSNMGGFSVAAATVFGAEDAGNGDAKGSLISLAAMYTSDNVYATAAIQNIKEGDPGTGDLAGTAGNKDSAFKLGGGYTMDAFALNLVYEMLSYKDAGGEAENTNIYLAGKYNLNSSNAVKLAYTTVGDTKDSAVDDGAKQISIGYDHSMSNNTMVYALYTMVDANFDGTPAVGNNTPAVPADPDPTNWSFGLKYSF